ncbi:hypothetical protein QF038_000323 [Pseudarthrobacter sp. W1I19]|nr:hypothetical protein [Pseudarthrobacter sp. W1I19]MDQ0921815.1 hypothetical protein [Pseudarthrobacter sp. W1I19]
MLWNLLVEYLRPHRLLLIAVVIFQLAQGHVKRPSPRSDLEINGSMAAA